MTREEELSGDCQYACPRCNSPQVSPARIPVSSSFHSETGIGCNKTVKIRRVKSSQNAGGSS